MQTLTRTRTTDRVNTPTPTVTPLIAQAIDSVHLGCGYTLDPAFDVSTLDPDRRIQIRSEKNFAPREMVDRYIVQMTAGVFLGELIITRDQTIVDGSTRRLATIERSNNLYPVIILDLDYALATEQQKLQLFALAGFRNTGGKPLDKTEMRPVAESLLRLGWTAQNIQRHTGVGPNILNALRKEIDAKAKLERVNQLSLLLPDPDPNNNCPPLRGPALVGLGGQAAQNLNDDPFRELAILARDAGLNQTEIAQAAKEAKESGSDLSAIAYFENLREENAARIEIRVRGGEGQPPIARQIRQHLGNILKYRGNEGDAVELNPEVAPKHLTVLNESIEVLKRMVEEQEALA